MKKVLLAVLAVAFVSGSAMSASIGVKAGVDFGGSISGSGDTSGSTDVKSGFSLAGEVLFPVSPVVELGGGLEYVAPRDFDVSGDKSKFTYMPIFFTINVHAWPNAAPGVFFKSNLGYNVMFSEDWSERGYTARDSKGGVYFGLGGGYVFDFGLSLDLMWGIYNASTEARRGSRDWDLGFNLSKVTLSVGYKFNI